MCQELDISMATAFWQPCFPKFVILRVSSNKNQLKWNYFYIFTGLKHFCIHWVLCSDFGWFSGILDKFWNPRWRIQEGGSFVIMMLLSRDVTSPSHVTYTKRKMSGHTIHPIRFIVIPPVREGPKKPDLNRVNGWMCLSLNKFKLPCHIL